MSKQKYIPGLSASRAAGQAYDENRTIGSDDTYNRDYVVRTIVNDIKNGLSEEKALDKIMKDPIIKQFEYLSKNGLNIRECFKDWARREIKNPRRNFARNR